MAQTRSLERYHAEQAARITQSTHAMEELQQQMRAASREHAMVLSSCEALQEDADQLRKSLEHESPQYLEELELAGSSVPSIATLRERASQLEANVAEAELRASMHIGPTPSTMVRTSPCPAHTADSRFFCLARRRPCLAMPRQVVMNSSCNPLFDLSAAADYAQRELAGSRAYPPRNYAAPGKPSAS